MSSELQSPTAVISLRCEVFDSHRRTNPPVAPFVGQWYEARLESQAHAGRIGRWAFLLPCSVVLIVLVQVEDSRRRVDSLLFWASNSFSPVYDSSIGATA
jgi:hypothetical protein